jgi:hypothetical protein
MSSSPPSPPTTDSEIQRCILAQQNRNPADIIECHICKNEPHHGYVMTNCCICNVISCDNCICTCASCSKSFCDECFDTTPIPQSLTNDHQTGTACCDQCDNLLCVDCRFTCIQCTKIFCLKCYGQQSSEKCKNCS